MTTLCWSKTSVCPEFVVANDGKNRTLTVNTLRRGSDRHRLAASLNSCCNGYRMDNGHREKDDQGKPGEEIWRKKWKQQMSNTTVRRRMR